MSEIRIGAEVGLASDHDCRGVVVDSHPERGWRVWWCGAEAAAWHPEGSLWLREEPKPDYQPIGAYEVERNGVRVVMATESIGPETQLAADLLRMWYASPRDPRDYSTEEVVDRICDDAQALFCSSRARGWLHPMHPASEVPDGR